MGDIADWMIDGIFNMYTGEYIGKAIRYPRSINDNNCSCIKEDKRVKKVRKELALLIKSKKAEYPEYKENLVVNLCRKFINLKYGRGWRERGIVSNSEDRWNDFDTYKTPEFNWIEELNKYKQIN